MVFIIINKESLTIQQKYSSTEALSTSTHWDYSWAEPICAHVPVPENLDPDCLKAITWQDMATVIDEPAYTVPAKTHQAIIIVEDVPSSDVPAITHEEIVVITDTPEVRDPETDELITPAVTHEETVIITDQPAYTIPALTHEETVTIVDEPEQFVPAVTHEELQDFFGVEADADKLAAKAQQTKLALVSVAYNTMWDDVINQMETVYGTKSETSATANFLSWKEMVESPASFVGSMFADEAAVLAFAQPKIEAARTYGIWRMIRIEQFKTERASILAE